MNIAIVDDLILSVNFWDNTSPDMQLKTRCYFPYKNSRTARIFSMFSPRRHLTSYFLISAWIRQMAWRLPAPYVLKILPCLIVFSTTSKDYAIEGYHVRAFDYLVNHTVMRISASR